ncbi:MAG TPA: membrane protein insertion efficiency factor YidD [Candidatus Cloacimonadota bacterium]|nr:membrane protein insertion efficiency factor YidD [Candidatus Cloacimonadota bacterium]HOV16449.1 membrane protein insertion efficiency factor YidD [Candidatus Cloacimonadota bacterium]HQL14949.1 membrane protein insertion efficiency factor YidD [Candidatus Cloacimonadota bacterium]
MKLNRIPNKIIIMLIATYQKVLSPVLPKVCRFTPSCSQYGYQAFQTYPFFKALGLTVLRILRCNPFHKGGYDPLPAEKASE